MIHAGKDMVEMREKIEMLIATTDTSRYTFTFVLIALGLLMGAFIILLYIDKMTGCGIG